MRILIQYLVSAMILLVAGNYAYSQLPDGSIAPNFKIKDINGNEVELYKILDEGKSVVLDISATWCGPCWSYHNGGVLEEVWETYGPDGTDEIFVIFVEGDNNTDRADLEGTGDNTLGDWITGIPYPMIDHAGVSSAFEIRYYPTLYFICPDRTVVESGQLSSAEDFHNLLGDCNFATGDNNMALRNLDDYDGNACEEIEFTPNFIIQNMGSEPLTSANIEVYVDGELETTRNWTGDLGTYGYEEMSLPVIRNQNSFDLTLKAVNVNGVDDVDESNNELVKEITVTQTDDRDVTLVIQTDDYGDEIYWRLFSPTFEIVAEGGNLDVGLTNVGHGTHDAPDNAGSYGNGQLIQERISLDEDGCYLFFFTDYAGDGICCNEGLGYYQMVDANGDVLFEGSDFGATSSLKFEKLLTSGIEDEPNDVDLILSPNPNRGAFNLNFDLKESSDVSIKVYDLNGQLVKETNLEEYRAGRNSVDLDAQELGSGFYLINVVTEEGTSVKRFVIQN